MPFKKVGDDDYVGPSGKHFNLAQVRLYYSNGGKFPKHHKSHAHGKASYACGGPVVATQEYGKKSK